MDLDALPAIDQHAHNIVRAAIADAWPYTASFTEAHAPALIETHARHTLFFRRSLRDIAGLLGCAADEQAILERRRALGLEKLTACCLAAANLQAILLDDGFQSDVIHPIAWHAQFLPVRRLLRIEALAEQLFGECESFDDFEDRFRTHLDPVPEGVVGLKSIACYRTGLDIRPVDRATAQDDFTLLKKSTGTAPLRLTSKPLIDYLLGVALAIASRQRIPVQLHTGFGDPDLDLRLANPLHLRALLEDPRHRDAPLVLLHASYPFTREAGYLASVYPQVYIDMGLAVPFLGVSGMHETVRQLLELAPASKVLFSSDAHNIPELFYLGALWGRRILARVLTQAIRDSDLTVSEADEFACLILADSARTLYRLEGLACTTR
jgi:uncharacterized protein